MKRFSTPAYAPAKWQSTVALEQADSDTTIFRRVRWSGRTVSSIDSGDQQKYPSYLIHPRRGGKLESYLSTRRTRGEATSRTSSDRNMGMKRLYATFSPAFRLGGTVPYARVFSRRGAKYNLQIDSASQTDEPSLTWALPQVLSDAGIKYFTNGSDPSVRV